MSNNTIIFEPDEMFYTTFSDLEMFLLLSLMLFVVAFVLMKMFHIKDWKILGVIYMIVLIFLHYYGVISAKYAAISFVLFSVYIYFEVTHGGKK